MKEIMYLELARSLLSTTRARSTIGSMKQCWKLLEERNEKKSGCKGLVADPKKKTKFDHPNFFDYALEFPCEQKSKEKANINHFISPVESSEVQN